MNHIVYLDQKAKELENLKSGEKTMIIRGVMDKQRPYGGVTVGDVLYFIENNVEGLIKAAAEVEKVLSSGQLTEEESIAVTEKYQDKLMLNERLVKRFAVKRHIELIVVKNFEELGPFKFDRSKYPEMDDWLVVKDMETVRT